MREHIMYAAINMQQYIEKPIIGIFHTKSEAKEVLLAEAQNWAYHIMNTHLPDREEGWIWEKDYPCLIKEFLDTTTIQEVEVKCLCE